MAPLGKKDVLRMISIEITAAAVAGQVEEEEEDNYNMCKTS